MTFDRRFRALLVFFAALIAGWEGQLCARDRQGVRQGGEAVRTFRPLRKKSLAESDRPDRSYALEPLHRFDNSAPTAEIVAFCASEGLLVTTNPMWKTLDMFSVKSWDKGELVPEPDTDASLPGIQGQKLGGEPTSVAAHPTEPIAFVSVLGRTVMDPGYVVGIDLRKDSRGDLVLRERVGLHPDSLAISPDGRWLVVACEAEGHPDTPGSIWRLDMAGISPDRRPETADPIRKQTVAGLEETLGQPAGRIEPEFVAFDPRNRFAAVSCQENDAVVLVPMTEGRPKIAGAIRLPRGSAPDGLAVLDEAPDAANPARRPLIGICEEGKYDVYKQKWLGNTVSFYTVDPYNSASPKLQSRVDARMLTKPDSPDARRDPEGIQLFRVGDRPLALITIERGDRLLLLDLRDPTQPDLLDRCRTGDRPEGIILVQDDGKRYVVTADEGNEGPGTISITRLRIPPTNATQPQRQ